MIPQALSNWIQAKQRYSFKEEDHPRDENGQFTDGESEESDKWHDYFDSEDVKQL